MLKPRNEARLSPCEAFWQKHNGFLCEKPILPYERSALQPRLFYAFLLVLFAQIFHSFFVSVKSEPYKVRLARHTGV